MSSKAIREHDGKLLLAQHLTGTGYNLAPVRVAQVLATPSPVAGEEDTVVLPSPLDHPWLQGDTRLVVKPDELIKRRGKLGLLLLNADWDAASAWATDRIRREVHLPTTGHDGDEDDDCAPPAEDAKTIPARLHHLLVEPFIPHDSKTEEHYVCIRSVRHGDEILFSARGGIDVGDVDATASRLLVRAPIDSFDGRNPTTAWRGSASSAAGAGDSSASAADLGWDDDNEWYHPTESDWHGDSALTTEHLLKHLLSPEQCPDLQDDRRAALAAFIVDLHRVYTRLHFTYLEINPLVFCQGKVYILDLAAKLDTTAEFECARLWELSSAVVPASDELGSGTRAAPNAAAPGAPEQAQRLRRRMPDFPAPLGRPMSDAERYIAELDAKTGASLKLTVLQPRGRVWTLVAGGGASVVYADAVTAALGAEVAGRELANYGEYSGAPTESQTFEYTRTVLRLMTTIHPEDEAKTDLPPRVLLIGGGIANFTNVAATFRGIARALRDAAPALKRVNARIWVRRGGPNYQEGLRHMRQLGSEIGIKIRVYGPDSFITQIVKYSLVDAGFIDGRAAPACTAGDDDIPLSPSMAALTRNDSKVGNEFSDEDEIETTVTSAARAAAVKSASKYGRPSASDNAPSSVDPSPSIPLPRDAAVSSTDNDSEEDSRAGSPVSLASVSRALLDRKTRAFIYGMQPRAVQGMLDFDYMCKRKTASVAGIIYPFAGGRHVQKFYWGTREIMVPVYTDIADAAARHPEADTVVNFASCRSAYEATCDLMAHIPGLRSIAIIAEGVPERHTKSLIRRSRALGVTLIGPATVGGVQPGAFKIGNTGGMVDNLIDAKLYRPGSVGYVSKSGGMSNELNRLLSRHTDGVYSGVAVGGDRYPATTFLDHILRLEDDPACKMLVLLGEVGGREEIAVAKAIASGRVTKPMVAWCIGTCADALAASAGGAEVQFGHAGAMAGGREETALAKNQILRNAGCHVPNSFEEFPDMLETVFNQLVAEGVIPPKETPEPEAPRMPIDYHWAQELGLIRKPANFVTTIVDDRGQELLYSGMTISDVFRNDIGIGGVLGLLWFRRRLPEYAGRFIEMVLMLTADHGPAVAGAHNTIVTTRAGKDLISALVSGLLTIGDRFGGALDGAAAQFSAAYDQALHPHEFVDSMRRKKQLIHGIGHRIKSRTNPDQRVQIVCDYARQHFPSTRVMDYALEVEKVTTAKKDNLILNVDGAIAVCFVDLLRYSGLFTAEEAEEYIQLGILNGLFVLGRSVGFIGHFIDQRRLRQGLYRHPWDDIAYLRPEEAEGMGFSDM
ncbi:hypothetical protein H696_04535 [Fonticula alba]|uniref:ATP citrate synthase n=1 Tax=Fonticula alba TaxID=691883 RepID=A0A058Z4B0_FONAL|nr:hypothetical protein H696_04535 [Fonticula alba]KCV69119.1 hypothetical protein H696_04535 [Fonticula alba]|eukprot:XP_009496690.1 hypothetical protein H696_04535 [Fonticula alba]